MSKMSKMSNDVKQCKNNENDNDNDNDNVNVNVKENENAGDIKKEKIFYLRAIVLMIFSMFLMAEKIENFFLS